MQEVPRPLSYSPYTQPLSTNPISQPAIYPARPSWSQQQHSTQEPLLPIPRPNDQLQSNDQPSMICGFTLTELAQVAIQVAGVAIAAVFGAWAVKAYESSNVANQLSEDSLLQSNIANRLAQNALEQNLYANILAIINLCLSDQYRNSTVCPAILQESRFSSVVRGVIPTLSIVPATTQTITATTLTSSSRRPTAAVTRSTILPTVTETGASIISNGQAGSGSSKLPFGALVGIIIGVVVAVAILCLVLIRYRRAKRSRS